MRAHACNWVHFAHLFSLNENVSFDIVLEVHYSETLGVRDSRVTVACVNEGKNK